MDAAHQDAGEIYGGEPATLRPRTPTAAGPAAPRPGSDPQPNRQQVDHGRGLCRLCEDVLTRCSIFAKTGKNTAFSRKNHRVCIIYHLNIDSEKENKFLNSWIWRRIAQKFCHNFCL
jgi:hypothetical protein